MPAAPVPTAGGGIQKLIHQIWLGSNPQPREWMDTVRAFAKAHGYTYKLWTEENIKELPFDVAPGIKAVYDSMKGQLAGRADIIRMLALYAYGGIYIDADSVIMKPAKLAAFLEKNPYAVFFAWEKISKSHTKKVNNFGPELRGARRLVANGVIGAAMGHRFFKALLDGTQSNAQREEGKDAWRVVGPLHVSRMYAKIGKEMPDVHIYPMRYFYPRHWKGIRDPEMHKKVKIPGDSMMFQYGYTTNKFAEIFAERRRTRRRRA